MVTKTKSKVVTTQPTKPVKLRRRLAPQERAGQILEFAAKLILEEGFNEVSMERLGREAGVSKALVYNYFPNQNDLLKSLLEREIEVLNKRQLEQARQAKDVPDLLLRTTRTYVEHVKERGALLQRLLSESSVARSIAIQYLEDQEQAKSYLARRVAKEYGLSDDTALTAVDMQMVLTEATARHLSRTNHDIESAVEIYVTMMIGGLEALGKSKKNQR
jgi:AcrR family transcriptional regulator